MDIIISLDYELFLNDITGTVNNCLIKPMHEIQKICEKYKFKLTIFVDAAYLYRLSELKGNYPSLNEDFEIVKNNIRWLVDLGHDIQLHIHPQWYYSSYNGSEWILDWEHYKLSDMPREYAFEMFGKSKKILDSIIGYKTTLFRAGGYSIQDFDYIDCFKQYGIMGDSSVLPGCKVKHQTHSYDYSKFPCDVYKFSKNLNMPHSSGLFWEFPICSSKPVNIWKYRKIKKWWMAKTEKNWGDGGNMPCKSLIQKLKSVVESFSFVKQPHGTIDYQSYFWLRDAYQHSKNYDCMTIIGHPKNFSPSSLSYLEEFVRERIKEGDSIITMADYIKK
jgi:hypothetical protein